MVTWLKPLLLATLAALCVHALGLLGIHAQMKTASSVLAKENEPLFTRTIEAASTANAPDLPIAPKAATETASSSAPTNINATPESTPLQPTQTLSALPTPTIIASATDTQGTTATEALAPANTLSAVASADSATSPHSVGQNTPTQAITSQPAGKTDSLLVTGDWPGDTRLSYRLTGFFQGELFGKGQVQWTRSGQNNENYQVRVIVDAGLLEFRMTSQGRVSDQGLLPQTFEEYRKLALQQPRLRPLKLESDALILENGRRIPRPAAEPMAVQDAVSQFVELGHRFSQGKAKLQSGQVVRVWLGRPGGLDEWIYDVGEAETMELPRIGKVLVHSLNPRPLANPRGPYKISMWLAPSLQYLPAKIRLDVGGDNYVELIAERIEQR